MRARLQYGVPVTLWVCGAKRPFLSISSPAGISGRDLYSVHGECILLKPSYGFLKDSSEK